MVHRNPLLARLYTLNQSWGKKVTVGLEYDSLSDHGYKTVVPLLAKDHEGSRLTLTIRNLSGKFLRVFTSI